MEGGREGGRERRAERKGKERKQRTEALQVRLSKG